MKGMIERNGGFVAKYMGDGVLAKCHAEIR